MARQTPDYSRHEPASEAASAAKRKTPRQDTRPELLLRKALWQHGLRYRLHARDLPGRPDIVFRGARVCVFCDGDFWHGKDWSERREKLERGSNPEYWTRKIETNRARDRRHKRELERLGWTVLRFWESDILTQTAQVVAHIEKAVRVG